MKPTLDTVGTVAERIAVKVERPAEQLKILLGGRVLVPETTIKELLLGPQSFGDFTWIFRALLALIVEHGENLRSLRTSESDPVPLVTPTVISPVGTFHVFCKNCEKVDCPLLWEEGFRSREESSASTAVGVRRLLYF